MLRSGRELWWAFFAGILITGVYVGVVFFTQQIPAAGALFGHAIGIFGFILMLMTEILYSLRKRTRSASWGKMSSWLQFHIFTGLVGPYMVLLHTSWKFNGLAGSDHPIHIDHRGQRIYRSLYLYAYSTHNGRD